MPSKTAYRLSVLVDNAQSQEYFRKGWCICAAFGFDTGAGDDNLEYTTVAGTEPGGQLMLHWEENYFIAPAWCFQFTLKEKVCINASAIKNPVEIKPGQSLTLTRDDTTWAHSTELRFDSEAPENGFLFINRAPEAAASISKPFCGSQPGRRTVYVNNKGVLPPGNERLIPKKKVRLWWTHSINDRVGREIKPGSMVSNLEPVTDYFDVDFTDNAKRLIYIEYTKEETWKVKYNGGEWPKNF